MRMAGTSPSGSSASRAGVITGYRAEIDPRALGYQLTTIGVKPAAGQLPRIPELALKIPEVSECHRITGEDCLFIKSICARSTT
jgi:Lrp/AsnC family leucine-responsive transcriptional regulator